MENKSFDDIIKSKLDQFNVKLDSDSWSEFEKFREDFSFDANIQHNLADYHLEEFPHDWNILNSKLEQPEEVDAFDAAVGALINGAAFNESADWEDFEKILDSENKEFDQHVSDTVKNHSISSSDTQWPKLSARIEEIERRKRRIVITKFVEAAIFILFIITLMQLYPIQNISKGKVYRTYAVEKRMNESGKELRNNSPLNSVDNENLSVATDEHSVVIIDQSIYASIIEQVLSETPPTVNADLLKNPIVNITTNKKFDIPIIDRPSKIVTLESKKTLPEDLWAFGESSTNKESFSSENQTPIAYSKSTEYLLASLDVPMIEFERSNPAFFPNVLRKDQKNGQYWLNTFGSPDVNFINTPYDHLYDIPAYQSQTTGYSVGASVSYETKDWEVDAGLTYTSLGITPEQVTEVTGNYVDGFKATSLKEIIMDIVQLPINFKYKLFDKKGWSIYSSAGVSSALIMNANYNIGEEYVFPVASRRPGSGTGEQELRYTRTWLEDKEFDRGVLNKGEVLKNIFFTLNTGVGISKNLNDNARFFVEPTYYYNLNVDGIGPNNDVHHRLGVKIGTKIKL